MAVASGKKEPVVVDQETNENTKKLNGEKCTSQNCKR